MLSKMSYKIMGIIYKNPNISEKELNHKFHSIDEQMAFLFSFEDLKEKKIIHVGTDSNGAIYRLTPDGEGQFLAHRRNNIEFRLTQLLAVLGLIVSIIALLKS